MITYTGHKFETFAPIIEKSRLITKISGHATIWGVRICVNQIGEAKKLTKIFSQKAKLNRVL
jgi:hypothetical protein